MKLYMNDSMLSSGFNLEEHTARLRTTTTTYTYNDINDIELPDSPKLYSSCVRTAKLRPRQMVCTTALTGIAHRAASATSSSCEPCSKHPAAARVNLQLLTANHCQCLSDVRQFFDQSRGLLR